MSLGISPTVKTPEERLRYQMRLKALRDHRTELELAKREGRAIGLEEGRQAGREEGTWIGMIRAFQSLLGESVLAEQDLADLGLDGLKELAARLQARLQSRAE